MGWGGSGETTVVSQTVIPPKSDEELSLLQKQNSLLDIQLQELKRQNDVLVETFPAQKALFEAQTAAATATAELQRAQARATQPLIEEQIALARKAIGLQEQLTGEAIKALEGTPEEKEIRRLSNERALAVLRGEAPPLSAAQREQIGTVFGEAEREGQQALTRYGEELAASRGFRPGDSPIADVLLRSRTDLSKSLAGAKAGAELNLGQSQQVFNESVRQFQEGLKQAAYQNRLALLGRVQPGAAGAGVAFAPYGSTSPSFSTLDPTAVFSAINPAVGLAQQERFAGASRTETSSFQTQPGFFDYFKAVSGAAGAGLGAYAAKSSARFKKDIVPLDRDEYDRARRRLVRETPITRWRYRWEAEDRRPHTGPILELAPEDIREDELHLNLLDYTGMLHAAVKAVDRDVQELQTALRIARKAA